MAKKKKKKKPSSKVSGPSPGHVPDKCSCGASLDLSGMCPRCKREHTTINAMPPEGLSWNEYKDYYG